MKNRGKRTILIEHSRNSFQIGKFEITYLAKIDLNKKWLPKQKTIQNFNIIVQGFRKTRNENLLMQEIEMPAHMGGRLVSTDWLVTHISHVERFSFLVFLNPSAF